jgi:hypothetical protein
MSNNCLVNVCGGIGNQLFQLANGYAYAKKHNKELYINDIGWAAGQGNHPEYYKTTIFKNFKYSNNATHNIVNLTERRFNYDPLPEMEGSIALNGYFQSLKYFEEYKDEFISNIYLPEVEDILNINKTVAFHIRRGDYLNYKDIHYVCTTEYFNVLFDKFVDKYDIHVFTDSPEYVSEEFKRYKFEIKKTESDLHDLSLLSKYKQIVCSNSTFSWWASLLGDSDKKIIVPEKWFGPNFENHDDIFRSDFIKLRIPT